MDVQVGFPLVDARASAQKIGGPHMLTITPKSDNPTNRRTIEVLTKAFGPDLEQALIDRWTDGLKGSECPDAVIAEVTTGDIVVEVDTIGGYRFDDLRGVGIIMPQVKVTRSETLTTYINERFTADELRSANA